MQGSVPSSIVYTDEKTVVLMDIQPVSAGHLLVIPKIHAALLSELDEETGAHLFAVAM